MPQLRLRELSKYTRPTALRLGRARENLLEVIATALRGLGINYVPVRIRDEVFVTTDWCVQIGEEETEMVQSEAMQKRLEEQREFEEAETPALPRRLDE